MAATKINLTKLVRTINANTVRGCSYEKFFTQKFLYMKISRSMVFLIGQCLGSSGLVPIMPVGGNQI